MSPLERDETIAETIAIVGAGQLGSLFASLLAARGAMVVVVRRGERVDPGLALDRVIVAVGEDDLDAVLASLGPAQRERVVLVQNELVPATWQAHGISDPTVVVVWLEKKGDRAPHVVLPSPIAGPWAETLARVMTDAGLPAEVIDRALLPAALLDKNVYILVSNLAGMVQPPGTTTAGLLELPALETTMRVLADVLAVESARLGVPIDADLASAALVRAFLADPAHVATGRSAPKRLGRTLARAERLGIDTPELREIARRATSATPQAAS